MKKPAYEASVQQLVGQKIAKVGYYEIDYS